MSNEELIEKITAFQDKQRSIKIWMGSLGGMYLLIMFFTYANMMDKVSAAIAYAELVIAFFVFLAFFVLNKISFPIAKRKFNKKPEFADLIPHLRPGDVDEKPTKVAKRIAGE